MNIHVTSPEFQNGDFLPSKYTPEGNNINPPLELEGLPDKTKSLAIIVDDPDAPIRTWSHWVVWNIPPAKRIKENLNEGSVGVNDFRENKYIGPVPPSGTHRYFFKVYALDTLLEISQKSTKADVEKAIRNHIVGYGELMVLYKKRLKPS